MVMMDAASGKSGVTVKKSELLGELKKNREAHQKTFLEAQSVYRTDVIFELNKMLTEARTGAELRLTVDLEAPRDHTREYDNKIRMLEMCTQDEIFISEGEFACYVQDDWGWKEDFARTTSNYLNKR